MESEDLGALLDEIAAGIGECELRYRVIDNRWLVSFFMIDDPGVGPGQVSVFGATAREAIIAAHARYKQERAAYPNYRPFRKRG
jgi:hypothetical protein